MNRLEYVQLRKEFGTRFVIPDMNEDYSNAIRDEAMTLIPYMFSLHDPHMTHEAHEGIIRLFEILKFGKEASPFVLRLEYDKGVMEAVSVWKDPHFSTYKKAQTVFDRKKFENPDLCSISRDLSIITNQIKTLHHGYLTRNICIAGTNESILLVGVEKPSYFTEDKVLGCFLPEQP